MATVHDYEKNLVVFSGTVNQCEDWIAEREQFEPELVHSGNYTIDMTEDEEANYQKNNRYQSLPNRKQRT